MNLLPLDRPGLLELAAAWLAEKENHQWLDFGAGRQIVTPALLRVMVQRDTHFLRVYTDDDGEPIGIGGFNSVDHRFHTATLWGVAGQKSFRSRGYATLAASRLLTIAFRDLRMHAVNTWAVDGNPSQRLIERVGFRLVGRQRQSHYIDGQCRDRLYFDLLAAEHREIGDRTRLPRPPARQALSSSG
jgi:RimJ/RimL family protein N-acetyltransferase